jgi:tRNA(adenine34) deaminase
MGIMADFNADDVAWMQQALAQAEAAEALDEVPVGAVLIRESGELLAVGHNRTISQSDPCAHAEIEALRAAGKALGNYRLLGTTLYVTLEPCAMCAMALVHARVKRVVFAAADPKTGACGSVFDLIADRRHNHRIEVQGGLLAEQAGSRLSAYFKAKRRSA